MLHLTLLLHGRWFSKDIPIQMGVRCSYCEKEGSSPDAIHELTDMAQHFRGIQTLLLGYLDTDIYSLPGDAVESKCVCLLITASSIYLSSQHMLGIM